MIHEGTIEIAMVALPGEKQQFNLGCGPHRVTVTTRIIPFLVGNPYKSSCVTVTGRGPHPSLTKKTVENSPAHLADPMAVCLQSSWFTQLWESGISSRNPWWIFQPALLDYRNASAWCLENECSK